MRAAALVLGLVASATRCAPAMRPEVAGDGGFAEPVFADWEKPKATDVVGPSIDVAVDTLKLTKEPKLEDIGSIMNKVGGLASMMIPPPEGLLIGGSMMVVGGIMSAAAAPNEETPLSTFKASMDAQFGRLSSTLNKIDTKLDTALSLLSRMDGLLHQMDKKLDALLGMVEKVYVDIEFDKKSLGRINSIYKEVLNVHLAAIQMEGSGQPSWDGLKRYLGSISAKMMSLAWGPLESQNLKKYLHFTAEKEGACKAAMLYHEFVATRFKLYTIQMMDSAIHEGVSNVPKVLTLNMANDLQAYNGVLHDLDLTWAVNWQTSPRASPANTKWTLQMLMSDPRVSALKPYLQTIETTPRGRYGGIYDHPGHPAACEALAPHVVSSHEDALLDATKEYLPPNVTMTTERWLGRARGRFPGIGGTASRMPDKESMMSYIRKYFPEVHGNMRREYPREDEFGNIMWPTSRVRRWDIPERTGPACHGAQWVVCQREDPDSEEKRDPYCLLRASDVMLKHVCMYTPRSPPA